MPTVSEEKWPAEMQLVQISNAVIEEFNLYFLSGIVNGEQLETLQRRMSILSVFEIEDGKFAFSTPFGSVISSSE